MKSKATLILLVAAILFHTNVHAYSQGITLNVKDETLDKVFDMIQDQTKFTFIYSSKQLKGSSKVSLNVTNEKLEKVLAIVFDGQPLRYEIDRQFVIVKLKMPKEGGIGKSVAMPDDVTGKVTNEKGEPIAGATVSVEGSNVVTATEIDGTFVLKNVEGVAKIRVTSVGYEPKVISIKGDIKLLLIKLIVTAQQMKEVVVNTGYQDLPKERSTGSFVKIDEALLNRNQSTNILNRITDVTSSLIYTPSEGRQTGGIPQLQIRGASTINASKEPLIVVDNFPYKGEIENINPNDVESITILRDAAASSIWGVNSGNGVIVITTKKGKYNQKSIISGSVNFSIGAKPDLFYIPTIPSKDVVEFQKKQFADSIFNEYDDDYPSFYYYPELPELIEILLAVRKGKLSEKEGVEQIDKLSMHDIRNDIKKYMLQESVDRQYAVNVSGGGESYKYYASVGYNDMRSGLKGQKSHLFSVRLNSIWKPVNSLEVTADINYSRAVNENGANEYNRFIPRGNGTPPYARLVDEKGNSLALPNGYRMAYVDTVSYPALMDWHYRPLDEIWNNRNTGTDIDLRLFAGVKYTVIPGLTIGAQYQSQRLLSEFVMKNLPNSYSVRTGVNQFMYVEGNEVKYPYPKGSHISFGNSSQNTWNLRLQANFERAFGLHQVSAIVGSEIRESSLNRSSGEIYGYNEELGTSATVDFVTPYLVRPDGYSIPIPGSQPSYSAKDNLLRNGSIYANAGYSYNSTYLFNLSARNDRSNLFGVDANMRRVPLWSSGVGWVISNERFFKIMGINHLKLKATYGFNGNSSTQASGYPIIQHNRFTTQIPTYINYAQVLNPANINLRWEKIRMINWGVDFGLFNGRVDGAVDIYFKRGIDLIGPISSDPTTGWSTYTGNYASMKGRGLDIIVNSTNLRSTLFNWKTSLNISFNKDRVTKYGGQSLLNAPALVGAFPVQEGHTLYALYSYKWAGLNPVDGTPRIFLADTISSYRLVSSGKISDVDEAGSRSPRIFGNIINAFSWNNFTLSCNITFKLRYFFRRSTFNYATLLNSSGGHADYLLRWQKPGDESKTTVPSIPKVGLDGRFNVYSQTNILVERGDHLRLQDVRLDYTFNRHQFKKVPIKSVNLYFIVNNVGLLWKANKSNIDPSAIDFGTFPSPRIYSFGATASF